MIDNSSQQIRKSGGIRMVVREKGMERLPCKIGMVRCTDLSTLPINPWLVFSKPGHAKNDIKLGGHVNDIQIFDTIEIEESQTESESLVDLNSVAICKSCTH